MDDIPAGDTINAKYKRQEASELLKELKPTLADRIKEAEAKNGNSGIDAPEEAVDDAPVQDDADDAEVAEDAEEKVV